MGKTIRDDRARHQEPRRQPELLFHVHPERPLTEHQASILKHIRDYIDLHGGPPSPTVASRLLKCSVDSFYSAVKSLVRKGFLAIHGEQAATIKLTTKRE